VTSLDAPDSAPNSAPATGWFSPLALVGLVGSLATIPYQAAFLRQMPSPWSGQADATTLALGAAIQWLILVVPAILIGLRLGPAIGLGRIMPPAQGDAGSTSQRLVRALIPSALAGLGGGAALTGVAFAIPETLLQLKDIEHPGLLASLLASFGAGTVEELMTRFGLMTAIAWAGCKLVGTGSVSPSIAWTASALAALAFALLHVPQMIMMGGTSAGALAFVLLGNGFVGMLFGWIYWRCGLVAAMIAHFMTDIVLHVIGPLIEGLVGTGG
jgi:hypothetical protein